MPEILTMEKKKKAKSNKKRTWKKKEFVRIDPEKEDFDILVNINETFRHVKQSSSLMTKQSTKKKLL